MKLFALTFLFIGLTTANFTPGLRAKTGSSLRNRVGGHGIRGGCAPPEWKHIVPDMKCDSGLECHCKVIIETPTYKKQTCSCQRPGSQAQLGNAPTIAIRKERGQWNLVGGGMDESEGRSPIEMEGSYGATGINPSGYEKKSVYGWGLFKSSLKGCVDDFAGCRRQVLDGRVKGTDFCSIDDDSIREFFRQNCRRSCGLC